MAMRTFVAPQPARPIVPGTAPSFSIIIPAYQAASFIAEAVESALAQTVPAHEVIVCDDGSTDDLRRALAPYADRITLLHKEHGGVAGTRNVAIRAATGDFVASLDSDNKLLPEYVEALTELAVARPDLHVLTTDAFLELDGAVYGRYYRGKARFVTDDQRRGIIHQHFVYANAAYRREALLAVGGYDEFYDPTPYHGIEDTDLLVRIILAGSRVGLVDEPLAVYRIHEGSLSSNRPRSMRGGVLVLERAASHPSLTKDELSYLKEQLVTKRQEAALAEAEQALRGLAPHPRRRCLKVAFGRWGYPLASRVSALAGAIAPRTARRILERRERTSGRSRLALRTHGR
jgi:glycosyltransferase involved in cell wall biosynthesis